MPLDDIDLERAVFDPIYRRMVIERLTRERAKPKDQENQSVDGTQQPPSRKLQPSAKRKTR